MKLAMAWLLVAARMALAAEGSLFCFTNLTGVVHSNVTVVATNVDRILFKKAGVSGFHAEFYTNMPKVLWWQFDPHAAKALPHSTNGWMDLQVSELPFYEMLRTNDIVGKVDRVLDELESSTVPKERLRILHELVCDYMTAHAEMEGALEVWTRNFEQGVEMRFLEGAALGRAYNVQSERYRIAHKQKALARKRVNELAAPFREIKSELRTRQIQMRLMAAEMGFELRPCQPVF